MATASAALSPVRIFLAAATASGCPAQKRDTKVNCLYGVKGHNNNVAKFGSSVPANQSFAKDVCSLTYPSRGRRSAGGGGFPVCRNAASEIFNIAAIMNGLVLVGVAVGFVLLRIEAAVEEAE